MKPARHPPEPGRVEDLPGYGPVSGVEYAGHLPVADGGRTNLFFWFVESKGDPTRDPIVLWLNGGPGSSSFLGFFTENGPYRLERGADGAPRPVDNAFGWHHRASYLMIDQPAGVGLSVASAPWFHAPDEQVQTHQLYRALLAFFARYPQYGRLPFYIFGESFAGHYIPTLAHAILDGNARGYPAIDLQGIGVGDGWVDPLSLQATYGDYAYAHGLIDRAGKAEVDRRYARCRAAVEATLPVPSAESDRICQCVEDYIAAAAGGINVYDVRRFGDYDFSIIGEYLDRPDVRAALHVDPAAPKWLDESPTVASLLERGEQGSTARLFPRLFESVRVLVYNGVYDMDCNFMGTDAWLEAVPWPHADTFRATARRPWSLDGRVVGQARAVGNVTQVLVADAGHLVPMDQPAVALAMLDTFLSGARFGG